MTVRDLASCPPPERWRDWVEYDARVWPRKIAKHYAIIPTVCFNCEAACGLLAYVDKESGRVKQFEGNPYHPGSRGRNCAKGPATINQVNDPERILYPLKRAGKRGEGKWERTTWDEVLDTFAGKIRAAIIEGRRNEVMYHVGRPGHDGYMERVLAAWGVDGHNSHTNVCSSAARFGYQIWCGTDRPSPDHANARFILLDQLTPGNGPLFQSPGPAHHRGQDEWGQTGRHGPAPFEHRQHGGLLAPHMAWLRGSSPAGDGAHPPCGAVI